MSANHSIVLATNTRLIMPLREGVQAIAIGAEKYFLQFPRAEIAVKSVTKLTRRHVAPPRSHKRSGDQQSQTLVYYSLCSMLLCHCNKIFNIHIVLRMPFVVKIGRLVRYGIYAIIV